MTDIKNLLDYDPETGLFHWRIKRKGMNPGDAAGSINPRGYCRIQIDGRIYLAHRLAWFFAHGKWPTDQIDHINGNKSDNSISNLREATGAQNCRNRRGVIGVYRRKWGWEATIMADGKAHYLGKFKTKSQALAVRKEAVARLHGEFAGRA